MKALYESLLAQAKKRVEDEKETGLTDETYRLISLALQLHAQIMAYGSAGVFVSSDPCTGDTESEREH